MCVSGYILFIGGSSRCGPRQFDFCGAMISGGGGGGGGYSGGRGGYTFTEDKDTDTGGIL